MLPHLEYCGPAWCPWTQGDKDLLEKVQKRAIGMVTNFRGRTYEEKLAEAGMITLEARRKRGDLIQAYRTFHGVDNVEASQWFRMVQPRVGASVEDPGWTRNSSGTLNVMRGEGRHDFRRNFWSQRVTQPWNSLPNEVKEAESLNIFKNGIDNLIFKRHLANVRP